MGMVGSGAAVREGGTRGVDLVLLVVLATLWGASYTFIKVGVSTIPPVTLIAARTAIAGFLLLVVMLMRGLSLPRDRVSWRQFAIQALFNSVVPFTLIAWAEQRVGAGLATILNSTSPIQAFVLAGLVTRQETLTRRRAFGVLAGFGGTCLVVGVEALRGIDRDVVAELAIVFAATCYGAAAVYGRRFKDHTPLAPATGSMLCGAAVLAPFSLAIERPWRASVSAGSFAALVMLAVFCTALAFVIYFHLVARIGAIGTTAQAYLRVPVGVAIGVLFLDEKLPPMVWIGFGAVVVGVAAMTGATVRIPQSGLSR
jgi:drug/metabolite transporter (DMT)-like permease